MSCPICHKPTSSEFRPFCSQHCANVDLGHWFKGNYRVPSFRQDNEDPSELTESYHHADSLKKTHDGPPYRDE